MRFSSRGFCCVVLVAAALASGCASLPSLDGRGETRAIADTASTRLGRAVGPLVTTDAGKSGIHAMPIPSDGFAARAILAATAAKSLDIQYYVWQGDQTGYLLFEAIWQAAERGVRVRILLDDANTAGLDDTLAALDAHRNIEVRLYNPLVQRGVRALNFVTDFTRVNRRMHNKSFTADNQVTIVGGRNIGNEYSGAGQGVEFADLEVMAIGSVVGEVSREFDLYWNSGSAYPAADIIGGGSPSVQTNLQTKFAEVHTDPESAAYVEALRETRLVQQLLAGRLPLEWADATLVRDDPAKTLDTTNRRDVLLLSQLLPIMKVPDSSFDLVSPYFVPGDEGTAALADLAKRGIKVRVLTNSLAATDVTAVHAGYAKRRCDLLRAGVQLYELKPTARVPGSDAKRIGPSALHAKTSAVDNERIFVGSFNFDQRSALLNTEMGIVIASPALARRLSAVFDSDVQNLAYTVRIAADGRCPEWIEHTAAGEIRYDVDPGTAAGKRAWVEFLAVLPIEWLL